MSETVEEYGVGGLAAEMPEAAFPYFGGKKRIAPEIWRRFGDVANYVEPFAGSLAVLLARPTRPKTETVNDIDGLLVNFFRAVQHKLEETCAHADWPVSEVDLTARHLALVNARADVERMLVDPEWCDPKLAGWWVWGACAWIGSGWCAGDGPWVMGEGGLVKGKGGVNRQLPAIGNLGRGVNKKLPHLGDAGKGVNRQIPHLGTGGTGVNRQLPHLGDGGRGVNRKIPHLGDGGTGVNRASLDEDSDDDGSTFSSNPGLLELLARIHRRLRRVRITCGDWTRVMGDSVTTKHGITGVMLDPPYLLQGRTANVYAHDSDVAREVRAWCVANGDNPLLRIALCGYEGDYEMPAGWSKHNWTQRKGYAATDQARANAGREIIWFSPSCLAPTHGRQLTIFDAIRANEEGNDGDDSQE